MTNLNTLEIINIEVQDLREDLNNVSEQMGMIQVLVQVKTAHKDFDIIFQNNNSDSLYIHADSDIDALLNALNIEDKDNYELKDVEQLDVLFAAAQNAFNAYMHEIKELEKVA